MLTAKSVMAYVMSLLAAEATLLYGIGINDFTDINLGILLQMIITAASVTLPWLGYSPKETPIGAPEG